MNHLGLESSMHKGVVRLSKRPREVSWLPAWGLQKTDTRVRAEEGPGALGEAPA